MFLAVEPSQLVKNTGLSGKNIGTGYNNSRDDGGQQIK